MLYLTRLPLSAEPGAYGRDGLGDMHELRATVATLKAQCASETRARQAAESGHRAAVMRADRAEHAEWHVAADLDRWRRLALDLEAELKSLRPGAAAR